MASFPFELVSPEKLLVSAEVESVLLPGADGEFEIMANHAPLLALLGPGILNVKGGEVPHDRLFIDGGFCDVGPSGCTVLAEAALPVDAEAGAKIDAIIKTAEETAASAEGEAKDHADRRLYTLKSIRAAL